MMIFGFHALLLFCVLSVCMVLVSGAVWKFVLGCIPLIFGLPLNLVAGASLYSKLLPMPVQGNAPLWFYVGFLVNLWQLLKIELNNRALFFHNSV